MVKRVSPVQVKSNNLTKYLLVAIFLLAATAHAALVDWTVDISVNDDGSNDWVAALTYNETVIKSDYFVLSKIMNLEVFADNKSVFCDVTEEIGTSIVCKDIEAKELVYKFHTKKFVDNLQKLMIFRYPFSITERVERFHISLKLPLGTAIVEETKLGNTGLRPFEPEFGREGSDGRRIFISWTFDKPVLGQTINAYAIYENVLGFDPFTNFIIIMSVIVGGFIVLLVYISKKRRVRDILPVLTDSERKLMEILLREKGEVDQRILVKETDFSKAKVSRIINELIGRGLLDKISKGRKNIIKLKKEVKRPDSDHTKKEDHKS